MCRRVLALCLLAVSAVRALAALPTAPVPNAGSELQLLTPPLQAPPKVAPRLDVPAEPDKVPESSDTTRVTVHALVIEGATLFPVARLLQESGFVADQALTLNDLRALAERITRFYRQQGYFVAKAVLPAQTVEQASVRVQVIEGRYGQVLVRNATRVETPVLTGVLGKAGTDQPIELSALERGLLLLNDLPDVIGRGTLVAGQQPGTSDLVLEVEPLPRLAGSVDADNNGGRYTGTRRIGATVFTNELFGVGDTESLRVQQSLVGLTNAHATYQVQAGEAKVGIAYTEVRYRLVDTFTSLQASGEALVGSAYAIYPVLRSRTDNLNLQVNWDRKAFHDVVGSTFTSTNKRAQVWATSLNGNAQVY